MTQNRRFAIIPSVRGLSAEATAELAKQGASAVRNPLNPRGASGCGWLFRIRWHVGICAQWWGTDFGRAVDVFGYAFDVGERLIMKWRILK